MQMTWRLPRWEMPFASPELELTVTVYNINLGHNQELMNACQLLKEYAQYVDLVRRYKSEMPLSKAVERAVEESIRRGILEDFLKKQRAEAIEVSIFEYDQEKHMQSEREEHFRKGLEERTRSVVVKLLERGMPDNEICEVAECDMSLIEEIRKTLEE